LLPHAIRFRASPSFSWIRRAACDSPLVFTRQATLFARFEPATFIRIFLAFGPRGVRPVIILSTTSTSKLLQGPNVSNDNDNEESIVTSKERDNYCYDIPNAKQDPRDLTAFKYSSIESETNTSMGTMNGGDGSPCFHKSRQFPTNTKIEFHQAVICDLFPLVARGLVKEESNVGGAGVLDRGT